MDLVAEDKKGEAFGILSVPPGNDWQQHHGLEMQLRAAISEEVVNDVRGLSLPPLQPQSIPRSQSSRNSPESEFIARPSLPPASEPDMGKGVMIGDLDNYIPVGVLKLFHSHYNGLNTENIASKASYPETELLRLEREKWIQTSLCENEMHPAWSAVRIYVLPDDIGRKSVPRSSAALRRALKLVMSKVDRSTKSWEGRFDPGSDVVIESNYEDESLFYIFNTLDSPSPDIQKVSDPYARIAMEEVLWKDVSSTDELKKDGDAAWVKTPLYSYQRRSAAFMIQRESEPAQTLDPRLQAFQGPTGQTYYYDKEEGSILREKRLYSEACGGILAETMGYGKTLICLAVILATRGHFPRIPSRYLEDLPVRKETASLMEMAAATAGRCSLPWKLHFDQLRASGMHFEKCLEFCERNRGAYAVCPPRPRYGSREATTSKAKPSYLRLCSGTLVVVPSNLVDHWLHEIHKHTQGLNVLVLRDSRHPTPAADDLLQFDIVLFSKPRFDKEAGALSDSGKGYESPLKSLHWLRIIVDEGHNFASPGQKTNAVHILDKLHVERRWVVSGTPSAGLYGIEVSLASQETDPNKLDMYGNNAASILQSRKKTGSVIDEEMKNLDRLRFIVVDFLNLRPWANSRADDPANWTKYIKPIGADGKRRKSPSLRPTLQSLVVRHRAEDINLELTLPKLHNKVVYLEPTSYDKLSLNLFIFQLTVNAITSERTDADYMFHAKNRKHLSVLINNLRHAGFWWTGFAKKDVQSGLNIANRYLQQNSHRMTESDLNLLREGIRIAERTVNCGSWNALSQYDELGVFVQHFPDHARAIWVIDDVNEHQQPLLLGISQARLAQKFVTSRLCAFDPAEGIAGAGIKARQQIQERLWNTSSSVPETGASNIKSSSDKLVHRPKPEKTSSKKSFSTGRSKSLPPESPLARAKLVATTSAKLTYLLERVLELQETEKIIIFYDSNNSAFWIAEGLELLGVEFRIYANTLKTIRRSEYLSLFNETETVRVLLMDLRQASHGLHIACASRVFIVNPIWDPNIESQAIKRAHRISQTKPVFVETLVLEDTLEDQMLKRRKRMSNTELQHAEKDPLDDRTMSDIIRNVSFLPVPEDESTVRPAYLSNPPGFFDRHRLPIPDNYCEPAAPLPAPPTSFAGGSPTHSLAAGAKRKHPADMPWIESDLATEQNSGNNMPKMRKLAAKTETVTDKGIIMITPRSRTPPKRRSPVQPATPTSDDGNPLSNQTAALPLAINNEPRLAGNQPTSVNTSLPPFFGDWSSVGFTPFLGPRSR